MTNLAGGKAYNLSDRLELVTLILTSFVNDKFYEAKSEQLARLEKVVKRLCENGDAEFVAQACVYARKVYGMRSITSALAALLAPYASGKNWAREFYAVYPRRVDDILETMAFYGLVNGRNLKEITPLPNAMRAGFRTALGRFDTYQLAKYQNSDKGISLLDAVNILRPIPTVKNGDAFELLVNGDLKNEDTWEALLSAAGGDPEAKASAWATIIKSNRLGYMALLKNLRNIAEQSDGRTFNIALEQLVNREAIEKSLVFPFRFLTAAKQISGDGVLGTRVRTRILSAINTAMELSLANVPDFRGKTLIALDQSGSMDGQPWEIGLGFAMTIFKKNPDADVMFWSYDARYIKINPKTSLLDLIMQTSKGGGGTNLSAVFQSANKAYDRIIVLTDFQTWLDIDTNAAFRAYKKKWNASPKLFGFDLQGYGTISFPEKNVYCLSGFSDKVYQMLGELERDREALIHDIEAVEL